MLILLLRWKKGGEREGKDSKRERDPGGQNTVFVMPVAEGCGERRMEVSEIRILYLLEGLRTSQTTRKT